MPYIATAMARTENGWIGHDVELRDVEDLDGLTDLLREISSAQGDSDNPALLFVEENDEWFAIVRVDGDNDPRVFLSDRRAIETSAIAELFSEAVAEAEVSADDTDDDDDDEDDTEEAIGAEAEPVGDLDVLADLGTPTRTLLALCAEEGQLPADIISTLCENAGCLEEIERLREA